MNKSKYLLFGAGFLLAFNLHAQTPAETQSQLQQLEATEPTPASQIPLTGQFYSANLANQGMFAGIYPGNLGMSAWNLGGGAWLVDDLPSATSAKAQSQSRAMAADDAGPPVPDGGGDAGSSNPNPVGTGFVLNTNLLYLQLTNVSGNTAYLNLCSATDYVYAVWSSPDLSVPFADWTVLTEVFPTDTNVMPFSINTGNSGNLFLRAGDWTGVTSLGNQTPLWWLWWYFQNTGLGLSDTNLDSGGNSTLLADYQSGSDPDIIYFSVAVTNNYVNTISVSLPLNLTGGIPAYYAISVDDPNYATDNAADWLAYSGDNINANLGFNYGWHDVWVGLKGPAPNATVSWQWVHLDLIAPPVLAITNPAGGTVDEPMIQLYGYANESLSGISYSLSNAVGVGSGQVAVTDRFYDTNINDFTTNYIECLDIPLTNGPNVFTLYATNLAGGVTITNFNFTLDYSAKTNPPAVQITWPQNGAQLSGTNFTLQGLVADPTGTATIQQTFPSGNTNVYTGEIERNGNLWLENLPLSSGTNGFTLTVVDVVGNTNVVNLNVVQSPLVFTVNPAGGNLWQATTSVSGNISDATYAVWVNGVKGTNNANGTWTANNVPINPGGTATFQATAYAPTEQQPDGSYGN